MTTILVIEDDADVRANVVDLLTAEGFTPLAADSAAAGAQSARDHLPALIICDIMLPDRDGFAVLSELRQAPATAAIPFVFLTARGDPLDLRRGMDLGADDYVTKPFTRDGLLRAVRMRLKKRALADQRAQAQLDELRASLALSLPHELRTPLTGILGFTDVLIEGYDALEPADILEIAQSLNRAAQRLWRLVENYLLYAELELIKADAERVARLRRARTAMAAAEEEARAAARRAGREADLTLDLQPAALQISDPHLRKLVWELMDNAFKFSKAGSPVQVSGRDAEDTYALSVTDQGIGLTAEQAARVGAYVQFDRKLREQQGSGLGLSLARLLAELHGGAFGIESQPEAGTTVRVTLPRALGGE